jgi:hypothetical protein
MSPLLANFFMLISCLAYSSTLKLEAIFSSEMSVDLSTATQLYFLEDANFLMKHDFADVRETKCIVIVAGTWTLYLERPRFDFLAVRHLSRLKFSVSLSRQIAEIIT